ncbi:hypothetical protein G6F60_011174 [Rhizopus arrhizus]|nr:hypothetical protein G6F61_013304 [Rhizopus arrhizus]KAG1393970.1 hypothetical protein G6F60_011174 [Rhizopus arrhizus]
MHLPSQHATVLVHVDCELLDSVVEQYTNSMTDASCAVVSLIGDHRTINAYNSLPKQYAVLRDQITIEAGDRFTITEFFSRCPPPYQRFQHISMHASPTRPNEGETGTVRANLVTGSVQTTYNRQSSLMSLISESGSEMMMQASLCSVEESDSANDSQGEPFSIPERTVTCSGPALEEANEIEEMAAKKISKQSPGKSNSGKVKKASAKRSKRQKGKGKSQC